jgi:hypothetical protein
MRAKRVDAELATFDGPPSPRQMRHLVTAMIQDNDLERAYRVAVEMVGYTHQTTVGDDEFYYWLGVRETLRALADGKHERWRERTDRKWQRAGVLPLTRRGQS